MGLGDLICPGVYLKFVKTKGPKNEDSFPDNISRDGKGAHKAPENSQGITLVAQRQWYCI